MQVVIDENYLNYLLYNLYHKDKYFSVSEKILNVIPESFGAAGTVIRMIFSTQVWSWLFEDLSEYNAGSRLDFRCAFNKDFLVTGKLDTHTMSSIQF
jgi:hypothetical protein